MTPDAAEILALQALAFVVSDPEMSGPFMDMSGAAPDDLRTRAEDPAFLAAVLDFLTQRDDWVVKFCDEQGVAYDVPLRARYALPGAEQVHWT